MLEDANAAQAKKRRAKQELKATEDKVRKVKDDLEYLTALAEDKEEIGLYTAEYLGKDQPDIGGAEGSKRRQALLQRFAIIARDLGNELQADQRANFPWFKAEWDRLSKESWGNQWPKLFLSKLKGVLDRMESDRGAFSEFLFDEQRTVFDNTRALVVPRTVLGRRAITPA